MTRPLYLPVDQRTLPSAGPVVHDQTTVSAGRPVELHSTGPMICDQTTVSASGLVELHSTGLMVHDQTTMSAGKTSRNLPFTGLVVHDH